MIPKTYSRMIMNLLLHPVLSPGRAATLTIPVNAYDSQIPTGVTTSGPNCVREAGAEICADVTTAHDWRCAAFAAYRLSLNGSSAAQPVTPFSQNGWR